MLLRARLTLGLIAMLLLPPAVQAQPLNKAAWAAAYDAAASTRFIPLELWTGGDWDGTRELRLTRADLRFGKRSEKRISGPVDWVRPGSGETIKVYERNNKGKKQLFALSSRGDGLGRVYDSRYERDCIDEVKFPLGLWRQGETRVFEVSCNGGKMRRSIELTIQKIDFEYAGVPHSLQFHWVVDGGKGRGTDMTYVYSPGRGLASLDEDD